MPKIPLLMVLYWKVVLDLHWSHQKVPFWGYSVFGLISYCNPHYKYNCKFRPWRSWAIKLNFFVADHCTKRHNKNSQPTCLDDFDKNWHALLSGPRPIPSTASWMFWAQVPQQLPAGWGTLRRWRQEEQTNALSWRYGRSFWRSGFARS